MNKLAKYIIAIAAALIVAFIAWYFSNILIYIIVSAVLSLVGKPFKTRLMALKLGKYRIPNTMAASITLLLLFSLFFAIFYFVTPLVGKLMSNVSNIDFISLGEQISSPLQKLNSTIHEWFPALDPSFRIEDVFVNQFQKLVNVQAVTDILNSIASVIINFTLAVFVITFITFFFLKEENMFNNMVLALFPDKYTLNVNRALSSVNSLLARYFIGISIETLLITVINSLALILIMDVDVSLAIAVSFLAGVVNVIPYIGPWAGGIFGSVMVLVQHGVNSPDAGSFLLLTGLVFFATHMIDIFVFQPYIYSNSVRAHPLEIFLVILIAGSLGGIIGMLVAIPAYTVIRVFAKEFLSNLKLVKKLTDKIQ